MCNRYALVDFGPEILKGHGPGFIDALRQIELPDVWPPSAPRYNVAPTNRMPVARLQEGAPTWEPMRWGLIPSWAKDISVGTRAMNARSETVAEKPTFRAAFKARRCLVPVSGYYEWTGEKGQKQPHFLHREDRQPLWFAGLWEEWPEAPDGPVRSYTIVTKASGGIAAQVHNRMPAIIPPDACEAWLDPASPPELLHALLQPHPHPELSSYMVTREVGRVGYQEPDCIVPLREPVGLGL